MNGDLLSVSGLCVSYGQAQVIFNISMGINSGSIVSVIGANGAGKTTLVNAIMGVIGASGHIRFGVDDVSHWSLERRMMAGLSLVPERRELFADLTVEDNLRLGAVRSTATDRATRLEENYTRFPRLRERCRQLAGTLSGGERQMLAMGRALMAGPRLLMLDEPSLGLSPLMTVEIFKIVGQLRDEGVSILLIEQNARAALDISDYALVMELGEFSSQGKPEEISNDRRLVEAYLGYGANPY
jgi:branched-chain amino acid transport system ATP-binding protein